MRALITYVLATAALVFNPFFACGAADAVFLFGLPQVEAAIGGTWEATVTTGDGKTSTVKFRMAPAAGEAGEQHSSLELAREGLLRAKVRVSLADSRHAAIRWPSVVSRAAACSNRTLVASAHACIDVTEVPLVLTALDGSTLEMTGNLRIMGTRFESAFAGLSLGDVSVSATITPSGVVTDADAFEHEHGSRRAAIKLVHTK
ncbi:MAG TPA: hypothetical protein VIV11_33040 [Kofleriaceae bacterium]